MLLAGVTYKTFLVLWEIGQESDETDQKNQFHTSKFFRTKITFASQIVSNDYCYLTHEVLKTNLAPEKLGTTNTAYPVRSTTIRFATSCKRRRCCSLFRLHFYVLTTPQFYRHVISVSFSELPKQV